MMTQRELQQKKSCSPSIKVVSGLQAHDRMSVVLVCERADFFFSFSHFELNTKCLYMHKDVDLSPLESKSPQ